MERDELKLSIEDIFAKFRKSELEKASLEDAYVELQASGKGSAEMQAEISQLTEERDAAVSQASEAESAVKNLKSQLQEQVDKAVDLEQKNQGLQDIVDELGIEVPGEIGIPDVPEVPEY